jgi:hypothetical protein
MRTFEISVAVGALVGAMALPAWPDDLAAIRQVLDAKYALTTTTADKTDIVRAGSVLVLKKSNLLTIDATKVIIFQNTYKNGKITQPRIFGLGTGEGTRTFVSGEKVWVTGIDVKEKDIVFHLFTDPFGDVRYRGILKFPIEKDSTPTVAEVTSRVSEVFDTEQSDARETPQQQQQQEQPRATQPTEAQPVVSRPPAPAEAPPPPIAPPPPPAADPKELKLGQTPDQVVGNFGQPDKIIKLASKQIYVYKDMKVTFVGGKVTDVQ